MVRDEETLLRQRVNAIQAEKALGWQPDPSPTQQPTGQALAESEKALLLTRKRLQSREKLIKNAMPTGHKDLNRREYDIQTVLRPRLTLSFLP